MSLEQYDTLIKGGTIYDGSGEEPYKGDIAISGQRIVKVALNIINERASVIDASGLAIAPGFINMLSWANESLIYDGRSESDIRQGITLEVMGEGVSMGPLNQRLKQRRLDEQTDIQYDINWNSLGEYLAFMEANGIATNIASFVGATTVRSYVLGYENRQASADELNRMRQLVSQAMQEGALGVSSALIYAPACFAATEELIALARESQRYGGIYASHLRSEGDAFLEALDEFITIAQKAEVSSEIFHLKALGKANWHKMELAIAKIEAAQEKGLNISANMYMYSAAITGLDAAMPPWVQEGGLPCWIERLKQPDIRKKIKHEMGLPSKTWENGYFHAGAKGVVPVGFKSDKLKPLAGKSLYDIAILCGKSPEDTLMDLVIEDNSQVTTIYFWMSEENIEKQARLNWVTFGSDASSRAPEGVFLKSLTHPRAYGNTARFLGHYVREKQVCSLPQAIKRLTSQPAKKLNIKNRGLLKAGFFADIVMFDPNTIIDLATYEEPQKFALGVEHVYVNGEPVLKSGKHTGLMPGKVVYGPARRLED